MSIRGVAALSLALASLALGPAVAAADSLQISTKPAQPVGGQLFEVHATGTTSFQNPALALTVKTAPARCDPDPANDSGGTGITPDGPTGPGSFDAVATDRLAHGQYVICGWTYDQDGAGPPVPAQTTITVVDRNRVSVFAQPRSPVDGQPTTLKVSSLLDVDTGTIAVVIKHPAGSGCASTPGAVRGTRLKPLPTGLDAGPRSLTTLLFARGTFRLCAWLLDPSGGIVARNAFLLVVRAPGGDGGLYRGRTSERFPVSFGAFRGQIFQFATRARYRCRRGRRSTGSIVQPLALPDGLYVSDARDGGRLSSSSDEITYRFSLHRGRVTGTLRERYISVGGNLCDSGTFRFQGTRH